MVMDGNILLGIDDLDIFVGVWKMAASLDPETSEPTPAETSFEWLDGRQFLIQRWHVDHPDAPDGIAVIGYGNDRATYLQHYFDSRGVERVYEMGFADRVWKLSRTSPELSQRFTGAFDETGDTITGDWECSTDGSVWTHDFELTYTRTSR
jgi:hypothetical protein